MAEPRRDSTGSRSLIIRKKKWLKDKDFPLFDDLSIYTPARSLFFYGL